MHDLEDLEDSWSTSRAKTRMCRV